MFLFGNSSRLRRTPGPEIRINCRACGHEGVPARSFESEERITLYFVVPLPIQCERHVVCSLCGADRLTDLPLDELAAIGPEAAESHLFDRVSIVAKAVAIFSVALFGCPLVGLPLGVAAMIMCRRSGGWPYKAGLLAIVLTVALWGGLLLLSAFRELKFGGLKVL